MSTDRAAHKERLEQIAEAAHLHHDAGGIVDNKILAFDMAKTIQHVAGPNVLELGVGDGMWSGEVIKRFGKTFIVDASAKLLAAAREKHGSSVTVFESFFEDFAPPAGLSFNTIIATHVLEHVDDPVAVLKRAREWLSPRGQVLIIVPNATSLHRQLAVMMGIQPTVYSFSPRDRQVGHVRVYDLGSLRRDIEAAGYSVVAQRGLFLKILPKYMMAGFSEVLLRALVDISDDLPAELMANLAVVAAPAGKSA